jgi:hypothetical protein
MWKKTDKPIRTDDPRNATQLHIDVIVYNRYVFFLRTSSASTLNQSGLPWKWWQYALRNIRTSNQYSLQTPTWRPKFDTVKTRKLICLRRHFTVCVHAVSQYPDCISTQRNKHYSNVLCGLKTITDHGRNANRRILTQNLNYLISVPRNTQETAGNSTSSFFKNTVTLITCCTYVTTATVFVPT